ncbi:sodium:proton antiporter [Tolypothrix sp. FACHB-123]|uniref:cation:proton antiporter n=1 Tax=Tolypothrix sp. FACHB-123 TaxID=2692868 RepID=UPI0016850C4F|nr:sodium:proton antiporter [Tolypothrix sp. FACHB-123]MBD2355252.1 sodium:proton antiporter [Tolypothrix sp. FACHB-123]
MEESLQITILISVTVVAGIAAQVVAGYFQIPSIVLLLLFGILLGRDCLAFLDPSLLGVGLEVVVSLSVALILFEGGLNLQLGELKEVSTSLRNLVTLGVLITLLGAGIAAHWLSEFPWTIAFLYASLVVVTGPTVINPLLKQIGVEKQVATLLEGEGVFIDPIGAILSVIVLHFVQSGNVQPLILIKGLVLPLGIGGAIGISGGWLLSQLLKQDKFLLQELKNLVVLASVWGLFSLAQVLQGESGLVVAVVMGIVLKASHLSSEPLLRRFNEQLSILSNSVLFILLAADLSIASVFALGWGSVLTVLVLMLIVRPVDVLISTWNQAYTWQQQLFLCWVAPRGIVAASLASLFAVSLAKHGINGGDSIKALVFLTIMMTVFFQGLTAGWAASLLNLSLTSQPDQKCLQSTNDYINTQIADDKNSTVAKLVDS